MRKLINKKGFSLVELMIVVVIMGILIAVAIPLYGAITENAEKKTCKANQDTIRSMFAKYCVAENGKTATSLLGSDGKYSSKDGSTDGIDEEFFKSFEGGFPKCSLEGHYYEITKISEYDISIKCYAADGTLEATHSN